MDERVSGSARESSRSLARLARLRTPGRTRPQAAPTPRASGPGGAGLLQGTSAPAAARGGLKEAFPHATVELWGVGAVDEQRIGLCALTPILHTPILHTPILHTPILHKAWCVDGQRPLAPGQHRYAWRYLVWRYLLGFVQPASGRTVFHLATSVRIPLFEAALAAVATAVGASPTRQILLVLDRAGWHSTQRLRVPDPDHVHLLFLPPSSPELQPAAHLWPLTNTVLVHQRCTSLEELEDAQAARGGALQARRELVRSTTLVHWWPQRLRKREGPRRTS